jgi:hypothetical protein
VIVLSSEEEKEAGEEEEHAETKDVALILDSISELVTRLKDVIRETITTAVNALDGRRLGEEISGLYNELKNAGLPEEMIEKIVTDFYRRKLDAIPSVNELISAIAREISEGRKIEVEEETEKRPGREAEEDREE